MWPFTVLGVIYLSAAVAAQDSSTASTPVQPLTVNEPPQPDLQLESGFSEVYSSEEVVLKCTIDGSSDWIIRWNRNQTKISGSDYSLSEESSKLTIKAKTSAVYTCQGEHKISGILTKVSNIRQINVQELPKPTLKQQSPWSDFFERESVTYICEVHISGWTFSWYNNGIKLGGNSNLLNINEVTKANQGSYTCKVHLQSRNLNSKDSNSISLNVYSEKAKPQVTKSPRFEKMYPGESTEFNCEVRIGAGWNYTWYLNGREIPAANSPKYKIDKIHHSNSGQYFCKAKRGHFSSEESDKLSLQVSDPPTPNLTQLTNWKDVFEKERVELSCDVGVSDWTFSWYKDGVQINNEMQTLTIPSVTQRDKGTYTCKIHLKSRGVSSGFSNSVKISIYVEKAKPQVTKSQSFEKMYLGESIEFNCEVRIGAGWNYMWYLNGREIPAANSPKYKIDKIHHSNSGQYFCKARRGHFSSEESDKLSLQVSDPPKPKLEILTPWSDVFEKEKVEMSCDVNDKTWTFTWYKNDQKLQESSSLTWNEKGSKLTISSIVQNDRGDYACKAHLTLRGVNSEFSEKRPVKVYDSLPLLNLAKNLVFDPVYVGERMTFTCTVSVSSGWKYKWYKDKNVLPHTGESITIKLGLQDKGEYWCNASRGDILNIQSNKIHQDVKEIPVPLLKPKNKQLDVFPKEKVELSCMMPYGSGWTYSWNKDGKLIQADNDVVIGTNGATITFPSDPSHHPTQTYTCKAELKDRSVHSNFSSKVTLKIYDASPSVTLLQSPEHILMHTGDPVSFRCYVNMSSGWEFLWYKDDDKIREDDHYNISSARVKDTGSYKCQAKRDSFELRKSQLINIKVEERPQADVILLTGWAQVFSTDSLILKCTVKESEEKWNYTWFRGEEAVGLVPTEKYLVTPQNDPDQSQYTCKGIRTERPTYSKDSLPFKTKNLLLKRRILLSISGCLFFGIILAFLGCIYFKIRKPVVAEEKPEENELFLTLKKQLEHTDNPCPLVAYITDAALNEAPKENDDMGLISSDSTELAIPTQEDQAVNSTTMENGGAMISFQKVN